MNQGSMDPHFEPGAWTTFMDRVHQPTAMDGSMDTFFKDLTRCFSQIFSCAYVLCLHMCSRKTVKLTRSRTDSRYEQAEV